MKRIYSFYDKEAITSIKITYDFPQPFYENLDRHLKEIFNPLFIKEINHRDKVIKIHSAYDSGKGMEYIPFVKVEKPTRQRWKIGQRNWGTPRHRKKQKSFNFLNYSKNANSARHFQRRGTSPHKCGKEPQYHRDSKGGRKP